MTRWVDGWNKQEGLAVHPSEIPEDASSGDIDTYYSNILEDEGNE